MAVQSKTSNSMSKKTEKIAKETEKEKVIKGEEK